MKGPDALALLVGTKAKKPGGSAPPGDEPGSAMGAKARAGQRLASAVKAGDGSGIAAAFKEMYDLCAEAHEEPAESGEGEAGGL